MKIAVERVIDEEERLVFTITVTEPHDASLEEDEFKIMQMAENNKLLLAQYDTPNRKTKARAYELLNFFQEEVFKEVLRRLRFSIDETLRPKFMPILQEIYNWIYDRQADRLKDWMEKYDPQRSRYYFDNDKEMNPSEDQESEHDEEDEEDDN